MKNVLLGILLLLPAGPAIAQNIVPPEVVRFENVRIEDDVKTVTVGSANRHYSLYCNTKTDGCITPEANKNYFLLNKDTQFKMPGAKGLMTLSFVQDFTVKYNKGENIGLVAAEDVIGPSLGIFLLDTTGGGYEQDMLSTSSVAQQASLDLQEKCAKQAQAAFDKMSFQDRTLASFTSHYNIKIKRCFIETEQNWVPGGADRWWNYKFVTDAYEGKDFGSYAWLSDKVKKYWEVPPVACKVTLPSGDDKSCKSSEEFDYLIKVYMN